MIEMPFWFNYVIWVLGIIAMFAVVVFLNARSLNKKVIDKETGRSKMLVDIRGADGFPKRHLVPIDPNGRTVTINGGKYRLSEVRKKDNGQEGEEEEGEGKRGRETFPVLRYDYYPRTKPFWGMGPQKTLRLEEYQEGNPEPIQPFYGKFIDENGKACNPDMEGAIFIESRLMVTATEVVGLVNEAHLMQAGVEAEERKERDKAWQKILTNLPSKSLILIGLGLCALVSGITLVVLLGLKSALGF